MQRGCYVINLFIFISSDLYCKRFFRMHQFPDMHASSAQLTSSRFEICTSPPGPRRRRCHRRCCCCCCKCRVRPRRRPGEMFNRISDMNEIQLVLDILGLKIAVKATFWPKMSGLNRETKQPSQSISRFFTADHRDFD